MRIMIIVFLLSLVSMAEAQWSTNFWPSWERQFSGRQRSLQVFTALTERVQALPSSTNGVTHPTFFDTRGSLREFKSVIKSIIPSYIDLTKTNDLGNYNSWFGTNESVTEFPFWTVSNLAEFIQMPTNYFDYTPYFYLNGLGGFGSTNDDFEGIGHQFGFTNSATAGGGDFFPDERTNFPTWRTTDYGWRFMTNVINELVWNETDKHRFETRERLDDFDKVTNTVDWLALRADFTNTYATEFTNNLTAGNIGSLFQLDVIIFSNVTEHALIASSGVGDRFDTMRGVIQASNIFDEISHEGEFYARAVEDFDLPPGDYFDWTQKNPTDNTFQIWQTFPSSQTNARESSEFTSNVTALVPIPPPPADLRLDQKYNDARVLLKWDVTNGFKFVRQ